MDASERPEEPGPAERKLSVRIVGSLPKMSDPSRWAPMLALGRPFKVPTEEESKAAGDRMAQQFWAPVKTNELLDELLGRQGKLGWPGWVMLVASLIAALAAVAALVLQIFAL